MTTNSSWAFLRIYLHKNVVTGAYIALMIFLLKIICVNVKICKYKLYQLLRKQYYVKLKWCSPFLRKLIWWLIICFFFHIDVWKINVLFVWENNKSVFCIYSTTGLIKGLHRQFPVLSCVSDDTHGKYRGSFSITNCQTH